MYGVVLVSLHFDYLHGSPQIRYFQFVLGISIEPRRRYSVPQVVLHPLRESTVLVPSNPSTSSQVFWALPGRYHHRHHEEDQDPLSRFLGILHEA